MMLQKQNNPNIKFTRQDELSNGFKNEKLNKATTINLNPSRQENAKKCFKSNVQRKFYD